ncbi:hypothetical protein Poly51_16080 [Rubripirellula tenax]|uniref:Uncharacterized protein n=1 Tax=Rubripirellula tenax TaxID=2528015 RepID=A0A5C6FBQ7_9BACT|nr:hypothetical protein [Rubripirellula tenax]TWU58828.1 hypothetical protein Poly51_16080 [Rubripirellula tenax]
MSHPTRLSRRPPQISIGFMMLMMVVFALMSAGLLYAARVPAVQEELSMLVSGKAASLGADGGRAPHILFIMFTFTSPLLLALVLSSCMGMLRWFNGRRPQPAVVLSGELRGEFSTESNDGSADPPVG